MVTEERAAEAGRLLGRVGVWAVDRPDVVAVGLAGSWARGEARMDSDVDLAILTREQRLYLEDETWVQDGFRVLHDPEGPMARVVGACG